MFVFGQAYNRNLGQLLNSCIHCYALPSVSVNAVPESHRCDHALIISRGFFTAIQKQRFGDTCFLMPGEIIGAGLQPWVADVVQLVSLRSKQEQVAYK